jgi:hypothetical protein
VLFFNLVLGTLVFCLMIGVGTIFRMKSFGLIVLLACAVTLPVLFLTDYFSSGWHLTATSSLRLAAGTTLFDALLFLGINWFVGKKREQRLPPPELKSV